MDIESFRLYCLKKPGTTEGFPFGEQTLVFKVMGKMYALLSLDDGDRANLKCDPEYALELREHHPEEVLPGYHMNKQHWNTVIIESHLSDELISSLIDHSYDLVVAKLPKKTKEELKSL